MSKYSGQWENLPYFVLILIYLFLVYFYSLDLSYTYTVPTDHFHTLQSTPPTSLHPLSLPASGVPLIFSLNVLTDFSGPESKK